MHRKMKKCAAVKGHILNLVSMIVFHLLTILRFFRYDKSQDGFPILIPKRFHFMNQMDDTFQAHLNSSPTFALRPIKVPPHSAIFVRGDYKHVGVGTKYV